MPQIETYKPVAGTVGHEASVQTDAPAPTADGPQVKEVKMQIRGLLDQFELRGLATRETVMDYRKAADADSSIDGLKGFHRWISDKLDTAKQALGKMESYLKDAVREGVMTNEDSKALMGRLVFKGEGNLVAKTKEIHEALQKELNNLRNAKKEGVIGGAAVRKLAERFKGGDDKDKLAKIESFDKDLEPYRKLWKEIRETLDGPALKKLEKVREAMDLKELTKAFEKTRADEKAKTEKEYGDRLGEAAKKHLLNPKMRKDFETPFRNSKPVDRRKKLDSLEKDLEPHRRLREEIDRLDNENLNGRIEKIFNEPSKSFSDVRTALDRMIREKEEADQVSARQEKAQINILSEIKNVRVKNAIKSVRGEADHQEKQTLLGRLRGFFSGKRAEGEASYQQEVTEARIKQRESRIENQENNNIIQLDDYRAKNPTTDSRLRGNDTKKWPAEKIGKEEQKSEEQKEGQESTRINTKGTFVQTEFTKGAGLDHRARVINMVITDKEGRKSFNQIENLNSKTDKVTISTGKTKDDRELNVREMKVLANALEADLRGQRVEEEEVLKKAA